MPAITCPPAEHELGYTDLLRVQYVYKLLNSKRLNKPIETAYSMYIHTENPSSSLERVF